MRIEPVKGKFGVKEKEGMTDKEEFLRRRQRPDGELALPWRKRCPETGEKWKA